MYAADDEANSVIQTRQQKKKVKKQAHVFNISGKLTPVHRGFEFPKMTCCQLVHNWFIGNDNLKSIPFRKLKAGFLKHVKNGQDQKQKMGRFMAVVEMYARLENCWYDEWDAQKVSSMWSSIGNKHIYSKFSSAKDSRNFTGTWRAIHNTMQRKGAFKKTRSACKSDDE